MATENSFDIVSKIDLQEVKNAMEQALKEVGQRFDFKGSKSEIRLDETAKEISVTSDDDYKLKSLIDILQTKLIKRGISPKALTYGKVEPGLGGTAKQKITLQQGIPSDKAKKKDDVNMNNKCRQKPALDIKTKFTNHRGYDAPPF